jgi:hypothetical protein
MDDTGSYTNIATLKDDPNWIPPETYDPPEPSYFCIWWIQFRRIINEIIEEL